LEPFLKAEIIDEAEKIDMENTNTTWMDSVRLEMENIKVAFETQQGDIQ
jgi:hypothetical protein